MIPLALRSGYYEISACLIFDLFIALAVGESRLKARSFQPLVALPAALVVAGSMVAGELAALRALFTGTESAVGQGLTFLALALGFGLLLQYLVLAIYRDQAGPEAEPTRAVRRLMNVGGSLAAGGTVFLLAY